MQERGRKAPFHLMPGFVQGRALTYTFPMFWNKEITKAAGLAVLLGAASIGPVRAEIYKSVDAEGHVTYSNTPSKGAKALGLEPLAPPSHLNSRQPRSSSRKSPEYSTRERDRSSPRDFPRVDSATQKRRDDMRFKILSDELAAEEKLLAEARANLKQSGAQSPEKSRALQDEVTLHVRNIGALKTELSSIK